MIFVIKSLQKNALNHKNETPFTADLKDKISLDILLLSMSAYYVKFPGSFTYGFPVNNVCFLRKIYFITFGATLIQFENHGHDTMRIIKYHAVHFYVFLSKPVTLLEAYTSGKSCHHIFFEDQ